MLNTVSEIRDANTQDSIVKFVKWIRVIVAVSVRNSVDSNNFAIPLVIVLFKDFTLFAINDHALILFFRQVTNNFAKFEVRYESFLRGVELNVYFDLSFVFHKIAPF